MIGDKLHKLRAGVPPHKMVTIRGIEFAVVLLPQDIIRDIEENTEEYMTSHVGKSNGETRMNYYNTLLTFNALRDPEDIKVRVANEPSDIGGLLDAEDIGRVMNAYGELLIDKAPKIEMLTQEELEVIKKHLEVTPLSDLSTTLLVHLMNCHQAIASNQ